MPRKKRPTRTAAERGPRPVVQIAITPEEMAHIDASRGELSRPEYVRRCVFGIRTANLTE